MNIILLRPEDFVDPHSVVLTDTRAHHVIQILKAQTGDTLRVGLIGGSRGHATIDSINPPAIALSLPEGLPTPAPQRHPLKLVLALPRPKMLRRVLRCCAEFGVSELHLIHSYRVEKSYWQSPLLREEAIESALEAGLERAGDTVPPKVTLHRRFKPFVEDQLPALAARIPLFIAHPGSPQRLPADTGRDAIVMIGPEGGFIPYEIRLATAAGARSCHLGGRIMSVDTAVNSVLARELLNP